jgi:hypothetical protein
VELIEYARHNKCWKKKVLTVCLSLSSVLVSTDLIFFGYIVSLLEEFVMWMTYHSVTAVFAFMCIFVVSTRESTTTIYYYYGVLLLYHGERATVPTPSPTLPLFVVLVAVVQ